MATSLLLILIPTCTLQTNSHLFPLVLTLQQLSYYLKRIHNRDNCNIFEHGVNYCLSKTLMPQLSAPPPKIIIITQRFQLRQANRSSAPFCLEPECTLQEPVVCPCAQPEHSIPLLPFCFLKMHFSIILPHTHTHTHIYIYIYTHVQFSKTCISIWM